jgi:hypothetical protein
MEQEKLAVFCEERQQRQCEVKYNEHNVVQQTLASQK